MTPYDFSFYKDLRYILFYFQIKINANIDLSVYDIQGRLIQNLEKGQLASGFHEVVWDAEKYASGMYLLRLNIFDDNHILLFNALQKITLVK